MLPAVAKALIDDPNVGMLFISFPINTAIPVRAFNEGMAHSPKPKVMVALGDTWQLGPDVNEAVKESPAVYSRSSDRMLRAIALYTRYGRSLARTRVTGTPAPIAGLPKLGKGAQPEWLGKKVLAAAGIRVPDGDLARTPDEAAAVAKRIGYPVVLKAQAAALSHKTEAGGVALNLTEESALRAAWDTMMRNVKRAAPDVSLDGALVEKMSPKGIELMVGAKRDPGWGTVLLLGLGGIWVEALGDVQLLPGTADEAQIRRSPGQAALGEASGRRARRAARRRRRGGPDRAGDRPADADCPRNNRDRRQPADGACQGTGSDGAGCVDCHTLTIL